MTISDTLYRNPAFATSTDSDLEYTLLLPERLFISSIDLSLQQQIRKATDIDSIVRTALEQVAKNGPSALTFKLSDWQVRDNLTFYKGKCYIPANLVLRRDIVRQYHDLGHDGVLRTLECLRPHYWWPGMAIFVANYVKECSICQQNKVNMHLP